jgi:two-component system, response regulator PdtaR
MAKEGIWIVLADWRPVVLIVEDELLLRISAAEMVADAGFEVVEAGNADEAIAILEIRLDIEIVFNDIQMPGSMDGLKLARFVRDRWPPVKLVATSGLLSVSDGRPSGRRIVHRQALHCRRNCRGPAESGRADVRTRLYLTVRTAFAFPSSTWRSPRMALASLNSAEEMGLTGFEFFLTDPLKPKAVLLIYLAPPWRWLPGCPLGPRN